MSLPADVARCNGVGFEDEGGGGWIWREGCDDCQRRTDRSRPMQSWGVEPPRVIVFECEYRIPPEGKA